MLEFDIQITSADLFDYNLRHSLTKPANLIGMFLGLAGIVYGLQTAYYILVIMGAVLLVYTPVTLAMRSKQLILLNPVYQKPIHYVLDDEGITAMQGEAGTKVAWSEMHKAISTTRSVLLYTTPKAATIFPRKELGDKMPLLIQMISANMPPQKVRIRQ